MNYSTGVELAESQPVVEEVDVCAELPAVEQERLILDHRDNGKKLARSILRRWRVRMPAEEVDSIVDLTLCEAAKRYRPEEGRQFHDFSLLPPPWSSCSCCV